MAKENQPEIEIYTLNWCPYCNKAKSFLKSKGFSYQEYNIDEDSKVKREMIDRTDGAKTVPQIFIDDQLVGGFDSMMEMKRSGELYDLLGIEAGQNFDKLWDAIIIGAGPAGLNTALYGARKGLDILILSSALGGQMIDTGEIDNYLGVREAQGPDLLQSFWEHVDKYGVSLELGETVESVSKNDDEIVIETKEGHQGRAKSVVVASGTTNRQLGVEGEKQLKGRGVHYCATCDGYLYEGEPVAIIGGGNAGLEAALDLAKLDCEVDLVEVQPELTGDEVLQEKVYNRENITVHTGTGVEKINGDKEAEKVNELVIKDMETEEKDELDVNAVFIEIGLLPNSDFIEDTVEVNEMGEIVINDNNQTSVEGIWAAGDVTNVKDKQIIISAAEGAKAALRINEYLE